MKSSSMQQRTAKKPSAAAIKKKKNQRMAWLRAGIQVLFFVSMPGAFVAGFSGVKHLAQWIGAGEVLQADAFVISLIGLCAYTILFGRFFCGYVCAFGGLGDLVYFISGSVQKKLLHRRKVFTLSDSWVVMGQKIKYGILFLIIVLCAMGVYGELSGTSPWDVFSQLTAGRLPAAGYGIGIVLFILILIGMALQPRFFCQFLCPMGAVFALLPIAPFAKLRRDEPNCLKKCKACDTRCPVNLKLSSKGIRDGECIACDQCTGVCPKSHIRRAEDQLLPGRFTPVLVKTVVFFVMGCLLGLCRFL